MSAEENKTVIRRLIEEVYNEDNQDVLDELVAPDVFNHSAVPEHQRGIEGFRYVNKWVLAAVPDVHYAIEDMIAEGDMVACPSCRYPPSSDILPTGWIADLGCSHVP